MAKKFEFVEKKVFKCEENSMSFECIFKDNENQNKSYFYHLYDINALNPDTLNKIEEYFRTTDVVIKKGKLYFDNGLSVEGKIHSIIGNVFYSYVPSMDNYLEEVHFYNTLKIFESKEEVNIFKDNNIYNILDYFKSNKYRENVAENKYSNCKNDFLFNLYKYYHNNACEDNSFESLTVRNKKSMKENIYNILYKNYEIHLKNKSSINYFIDLYLSKISINDFLNNIFNEGYEIYILSNMEYRYNEYTDGIILNNTLFPNSIIDKYYRENYNKNKEEKYYCNVSYSKYTHENFINFSKKNIEPTINNLSGSLEFIQDKINSFFEERNNDINKWNILDLKEEDYGYSLKLYNERYEGKIKNVLYINIKRINN